LPLSRLCQHVAPDVEAIVERDERYWVVQKIRAAAEIAEEDATSGRD
jgi:hypothetical protein